MSNIEKVGPFGVIVATLSCSACFPTLAGLGSVLGLGFLQTYEKEALIIMQLFIVISMVLSYYTFKRNKYKPTFYITIISGLIMLGSWYIFYIPAIFYLGMVGLIIGAIWNVIIDKKLPSCKDGACDFKCDTK